MRTMGWLILRCARCDLKHEDIELVLCRLSCFGGGWWKLVRRLPVPLILRTHGKLSFRHSPTKREHF
jgi:hypothetical protein